MKTGLGIQKMNRKMIARINLWRFTFRKIFFGFDLANHFLSGRDKFSIQLILKKNGASIGNDCDLESGLRFHNCRDYRNLKVGNNCHIGKDCFFDLRERISIGNNVVISMQCTFITHLDMTQSRLSKVYPSESAPVSIGNDSYLGARSTVLMGVDIGERVIVSACALVRDSVPGNSLVAGVPTKLIKTIG
ncbi:MAG: acyltransferase [Bacteroidota bacterium]